MSTPPDHAGDGGGAGESGEPADLVAAAVVAVPGVSRLHGGAAGEVATHLPRRRVVGVRLRDGGGSGGSGCAVHVVVGWDAPIGLTTDLVRDAVRVYVDGPVDVVVEDVDPPTTGLGRMEP